MGVIGEKIGSFAGGHIGGYVGSKFGGNGKDLGKRIGTSAGSVLGSELIPFKKGGLVKPKGRKRTQPALLHKGELVVPKRFVKQVPKKLKSKIKANGAEFI